MSVISRVKSLLIKLLSWLLRVLPLQNIVVLNSFKGKGMGDDPKYIALELLRRQANVKLVWIVDDVRQGDFPDGIKPVKKDSIKTLFYMSIARVWISNCRDMSSKALKRNEQYYIQTWHAILGLKKVGTENTKSSNRAREIAISDSKNVDLMYSNNDVYFDLYKNKFWYEGTVIKCDSPRIAYLMHHPKSLKSEICSHCGISKGVHIAMYAPTFRDHDYENAEVYKFDYERILDALEQKFGGNFILFIRLHPNLRKSHAIEYIQFNERIVDVTSLPDMQELLCVADVLLTDYSSSMFDGAVVYKPVFLIAKDVEQYINDDRELCFDPRKELPFSFSESEDELIDAIGRFDEPSYKKSCDAFFQKIGLVDGGNGDKILADIVLSKMKF